MDPGTDLGTVVSEDAAAEFERRVCAAAESGADILYRSRPPRRAAAADRGSIGSIRNARLVMQETFGPVLPVVRVPDDDEEVVRISNSTPFGLSSGVCTNDFRRMQKYVAGLEVGTVNIWEVPRLPNRNVAIRRNQGQRPRVQGGRRRGDEELHQRQDLLVAVVGSSPASSS